MSYTNTVVRNTFAGDGATVTFAIPATVIDPNTQSVDIDVYTRGTITKIETLKVEGSGNDYTLSGSPAVNVVFNTPPLATELVIIDRKVDLTQPLDVTTSQNMNLPGQELQLDKLVAMVQQIAEDLKRAPKLNLTTIGSGTGQVAEPVLPDNEASRVIGWDLAGTAMKNYTFAEIIAAQTTVVANTTGFGAESSPVTIANNQVAAADVTGMTIDSSTERSALFWVQIKRTTASLNRFENMFVIAQWDGAAYQLDNGMRYGDESNVTFSINVSTGQIQYTSDNMTGGSYSGEVKWKKMVIV